MDAVILVGGIGTRLRPWTETLPKPLIPIANIPLIDHLIARLRPAVSRVILAVGYRSPQLQAHARILGQSLEVVVVEEEQLLGTGGAVKNVEAHLDPAGPFLVCNGDIINSLDIPSMIAAHQRHGGWGTLALWEVADPSRFGVVALEGQRITRFVEKPPAGSAPSNLISAGTYVLEPQVLDLLQPGVVASIEREVFPQLVERGLFGHRFDGFWEDAGTLPSMLRAQRLILEDPAVSLPAHAGPILAVDVHLHPGAVITPPVTIDPSAILEAGASVGPNAAIGPGCRIGGGCTVRDSILGRGVRIAAGALVEGSMLADGATVGRGASLRESIIGELTKVPPKERWEGARQWDGFTSSGSMVGLGPAQG